jgi:hypothetical protein
MSQPLSQPGPEHKQLELFVGHWQTEGEIQTGPGQTERLVATDTYEWLPGGFFLLHRVDGHLGEAEVKTLEVIGYDAAKQRYFTQSFDNQGQAVSYHASLTEHDWKIFGTSERFSGHFNQDATVLKGQWERSEDGVHWQAWMDIKLTKQNPG